MILYRIPVGILLIKIKIVSCETLIKKCFVLAARDFNVDIRVDIVKLCCPLLPFVNLYSWILRYVPTNIQNQLKFH